MRDSYHARLPNVCHILELCFSGIHQCYIDLDEDLNVDEEVV